MSKVPSRYYCTSCKKGIHGMHCHRGECTCKCIGMSAVEFYRVLNREHKETEVTYSKESTEHLENLMSLWRKING